MLTIEVNGQLVTWPEEFADLMIAYYKQHEIPFIVYRNGIHNGGNTVS